MQMTLGGIPLGYHSIGDGFIAHNYSKYLITSDEEQGGGWAVIHNLKHDASTGWEPVFDVVSFCDRLEGAVCLIDALTNPHVRYPD